MNDMIESIRAALRAEFLSSLDTMDVEHKVSVKEAVAHGGTIDYKNGCEDVSIKSARLARKTDKESGGFYYALKVVVD